MTETQVRDNQADSRFEVEVNGSLAIAEYRIDGDRIAFTHTVVPAELEGQGLGSALAKAGLATARERGLKVVPLCSFFAGYMKRHPETQDLLDPGFQL